MTHIIPPRRNEVLTTTGVGTNRFMEYLERTADTINDTADIIDSQVLQKLSASIFALQVQVGSAEFLTSDCDSFTVDSDILYTDQTEA